MLQKAHCVTELKCRDFAFPTAYRIWSDIGLPLWRVFTISFTSEIKWLRSGSGFSDCSALNRVRTVFSHCLRWPAEYHRREHPVFLRVSSKLPIGAPGAVCCVFAASSCFHFFSGHLPQRIRAAIVPTPNSVDDADQQMCGVRSLVGSLIWLLPSMLGNERTSGVRRRAFGLIL